MGYTSKCFAWDGENGGKDLVPLTPVKKDEGTSAALKIGLTVTPEFKYGIGIQTGIFYELTAASHRDRSEGYKVSMSEHSLDIPLRVQYRYEIIRDLSVFLYTGPEFEIGLAYTMKEKADEETDRVSLYGDEMPWRRFRMYWGVGAGIQWKYLQLRMGGDWGLLSCYKYVDYCKMDKPFNICLSYLF